MEPGKSVLHSGAEGEAVNEMANCTREWHETHCRIAEMQCGLVETMKQVDEMRRALHGLQEREADIWKQLSGLRAAFVGDGPEQRVPHSSYRETRGEWQEPIFPPRG